ncbi:MAG: cbb3-type cytochrome oxidase assembly protein [Candidatus Brocadiales bacterium]
MNRIVLCIFCEAGMQQSIYFILSVVGAGLLGFVALFLWSWARGQYRDIEAPKFKMLELEEKQEEAQDGC